MTASPPLELPLHAAHEASGARFEAFRGWNLPRAYERGTGAEYAALRDDAAITERTQFSRLLVTGPDAIDILDTVFNGHVRELEEDRSMETFCTDEAGRIGDLVTLSRTGGISYLVVGEPGRGVATEQLLKAATLDRYDVRIDNRTGSTCGLAIIGPKAEQAVAKYVSPDLPRYLRPGHLVTFEFHGYRSSVTRSQDEVACFTFMLAPQVASHLWESATSGGLVTAGFEAMETIRVEDRLPSWTGDLNRGLTPEEANLVPGTPDRSLAALRIEGAEPVEGGAPVHLGDRNIGFVTSSIRSPRLDGTAALALIESSSVTAAAQLSVAGRYSTIRTENLHSRRSP